MSLNFDLKDAEGKPATPEAYLKHYVLAEATDVIAAAGVLKRAYGVVGMAAVGKTVALQGLAFDEDIRKHFFGRDPLHVTWERGNDGICGERDCKHHEGNWGLMKLWILWRILLQ